MRPILEIKDAGYGETPECDSRFKVGDVVLRRKRKWLSDLPTRCVIAAVVPPGFPPEYAIADARKQPRPLMVSKGAGVVKYVVGFEGDRRPYLLSDADIKERIETGAKVTWEASPERDSDE